MSDLAKQRVTRLTDLAEIVYLEKHSGELNVPAVIREGNGQVWADAFDLSAWRSTQPHFEASDLLIAHLIDSAADGGGEHEVG